jgi:Ras-related C3 botulinum toxin substrate 1
LLLKFAQFGKYKTCFLFSQVCLTFTTNAYPGDHVPDTFDTFEVMFSFDNNDVKLVIWNTAGNDEYAQIRPLSYPETDAFILFFSVMDPESLESIKTTYYPEIVRCCPQTPYILVGTEIEGRLGSKELAIPTDVGQRVAAEIKAAKYLECSAKTMQNIKQVFTEASRLAYTHFNSK